MPVDHPAGEKRLADVGPRALRRRGFREAHAQRDYFAAHTYERTDTPRGEFFHTNWTGRGGTTASTTYNV
jgi:hypothetical protein